MAWCAADQLCDCTLISVTANWNSPCTSSLLLLIKLIIYFDVLSCKYAQNSHLTICLIAWGGPGLQLAPCDRVRPQCHLLWIASKCYQSAAYTYNIPSFFFFFKLRSKTGKSRWYLLSGWLLRPAIKLLDTGSFPGLWKIPLIMSLHHVCGLAPKRFAMLRWRFQFFPCKKVTGDDL